MDRRRATGAGGGLGAGSGVGGAGGGSGARSGAVRRGNEGSLLLPVVTTGTSSAHCFWCQIDCRKQFTYCHKLGTQKGKA
ncbi:hypothetical protein MRB53_005695 [Persea americana]|uniref:Uncharacterized protein n=1 Tax=Persea americana TaxID=3435 RepID=A0ACC2MDT1_PERAE|nr:hypothetical protein MRB53_005695 [Persea americana]